MKLLTLQSLAWLCLISLSCQLENDKVDKSSNTQVSSALESNVLAVSEKVWTCSICNKEVSGRGFEEISDGVWRPCAEKFQCMICSEKCGLKHTGKWDALAANNSIDFSQNENNVNGIEYQAPDLPGIITEINFGEFILLIDRDLDKKTFQNLRTNTLLVLQENLGESIEDATLRIKGAASSSYIIERRYETSIVIDDEGPRCGLTDWKHFNSDWEQLNKNSIGDFVCQSFTEDERKKFTNISLEELRNKVKLKCDDRFFDIVKNATSPNEYPIQVEVSKIYLKITSHLLDGSSTARIIIIHTAIGC